MRQAIRKRSHDDGTTGRVAARGRRELPLPAPNPAVLAAQVQMRPRKRATPHRVQRSPQAEHREAAWRLSRAIRRAPGPAAQARIGGLVCGHLLAMLREGREKAEAINPQVPPEAGA